MPDANGEASPYEQDVGLVERCLDGDKDAWVELVSRYRRLIYSIPAKMGLEPEEADEVFQDVCVKLLSRLDTLRDGRSLARWLIVTTQRRAWDLSAHERRYVTADDDDGPGVDGVDPSPWGEALVLEAERAHHVRAALDTLSETCRSLLEGLFFRDPPLSYADLAKELGRPHGSLGPTRIRCLRGLRDRLVERGIV